MTQHLSGADARLDALVNVHDIDQLTACHMLWAPHLVPTPAPAAEPPAFGAPIAEQRAWAARRGRDIVRRGMADVLAWIAGGAPHATR